MRHAHACQREQAHENCKPRYSQGQHVQRRRDSECPLEYVQRKGLDLRLIRNALRGEAEISDQGTAQAARIVSAQAKAGGLHLWVEPREQRLAHDRLTNRVSIVAKDTRNGEGRFRCNSQHIADPDPCTPRQLLIDQDSLTSCHQIPNLRRGGEQGPVFAVCRANPCAIQLGWQASQFSLHRQQR